MKKYLLSILLVFAVIVGTVFATTMTASAATASSISVCGVTMNNGTTLLPGVRLLQQPSPPVAMPIIMMAT